MADEDQSLQEGQDEEYKELRKEGIDKADAAEEAAGPGTTEARVEEAEESDEE